MRPFFVYLLRCADGSYYAGHTDDLERRVAQHQAGETGGYTHERRPVELVWSQETAGRDEALAAELQIKGWSRAKKEALIANDWARVSALARSGGAGIRPAKPAPGPAPVRAEPVEALISQSAHSPGAGLRQAQPERDVSSVRAEPVEALYRHVISQGRAQRRAIAKAITLLESTRADHRAQADELLTALLPHTGRAFRLGISGVPGVGKSTFIEALGLQLIGHGHRVAVLTIDPSSTVSGGSILGDKTRMEKLSMDERAYIRPSPSSGTLGGVAEKTREAMLVCEAAGYGIVIVETVGVGQSEIAVAGMTDCFVLMQLPNAGDDLQAIKKGVMEIADLVVINKADIDPAAATRAESQITSAMRLFTQHGHAEHATAKRVLQLSALHAQGVDAFWSAVEAFRVQRETSGALQQRRQQQALAWMWERIDAGLKASFRGHAQVQAQLPQLTADVAAGRVAASTAARKLLLASTHAA